MDVFIQSCNDVITRHTNKNINKSLGFHFDNFLKIIAHIKTNHNNANRFYGVKGSWRAIYLKKYKTFAYHL